MAAGTPLMSRVSTASITSTLPSSVRCSSTSMRICMPNRSMTPEMLVRPFRPLSAGIMSYSFIIASR